ncbi:hypothetical protein MHYP_G00153090 [Metynnis hypsauchen]
MINCWREREAALGATTEGNTRFIWMAVDTAPRSAYGGLGENNTKPRRNTKEKAEGVYVLFLLFIYCLVFYY